MSSDGDNDGIRRSPEHHPTEPQHEHYDDDPAPEPHPYYHYPHSTRHSPNERYWHSTGPPPDHHTMGPPDHRTASTTIRPRSHHQVMPPEHNRPNRIHDREKNQARPLAASPSTRPEGHSPLPLEHYPPPYGYGPTPGGPSPPYGYFAPGYYPPGYPPPQHYPGYPPYPPAYGYPPGPYPSQHRNDAMTMRPPTKRKSPIQTHSMTQRADKDPIVTRVFFNPDIQQDVELERSRSQSNIQVKPIRTNFHFFVSDVEDTVQKDAVRECGEHHTDPFLLYSNMNARLIQKWQDLPLLDQEAYRKMEEDDRIRFQNDDDIASRHCATLTARARSPRDGDDDVTLDTAISSSDGDAHKRSSPSDDIEILADMEEASIETESPPKRIKQEEVEEEEEEEEPDN